MEIKIEQLSYNLQLFAKDGPTGEKTEKPTAKKIKDSRQEGQVAKSQELSIAITLLGAFILIRFWIGHIGEQLLNIFPKIYNIIPQNVTQNPDPVEWHGIFVFIYKEMLVYLAPFFIVGFIIAFMSNKLQFKWLVTFKPLKPKFGNLSPIKGVKRLFSPETLMKTVFSILKVVIIGVLVYNTVKDKWMLLFDLYDYSLTQALEVVGNLVIDLGIKISAVLLIVGFGDFIYQKWKNSQDLMMSKQDIKDEYKNAEGDPQIKSRIRAKQREMSQKRMMEAIPQADVIITNPTHFAVAIMYQAMSQSAPIVVAKGSDYLAQKIKEMAREANVEIVENKPLARMLYHNVEIDQEIPPELYQAVAEVLAYVYKLKQK